MKDYDFFPGEGKFYKANLHCHTVISDGKLTKEQIKEEYQKRGYSIVAFTDHRTYGYHPELTDENFIAPEYHRTQKTLSGRRQTILQRKFICAGRSGRVEAGLNQKLPDLPMTIIGVREFYVRNSENQQVFR